MHHNVIIPLTMKHKNISKIFDQLEIYNEIHILKMICSLYNILPIYKRKKFKIGHIEHRRV